MRAVDLIEKKKQHQTLTREEIEFLLGGYHQGKIPDYQISAFLMAVCFNGMEMEELSSFTEVMTRSGETISLTGFAGFDRFIVDKHSTGGVGDKTTIALAPLLASFDIATLKLSGRGLGHTGGTIDKLESIPGLKAPETRPELMEILEKTGIAIMGYSDTMVPLDKLLYSLRDVTATVKSIPLIASSIMSKKLAVASDVIMLDIKVGDGAFLKTIEEAKELGDAMVTIGKNLNRRVVTVLSAMDQPLGMAVGNSLEVMEAIETLKGNGPEDFTQLIETLVALSLKLKGEVADMEAGKMKTREMIQTGRPIEKLKDFIRAMGGDESCVNDYSKLAIASEELVLTPHQMDLSGGYISSLQAEKVGRAAMILGAGRENKQSTIDHSVGIQVKKIGARIESDGEWAKVYHPKDIDPKKLKSVVQILKSAVAFSQNPVEITDSIIEIKST